MPRRPTRSPVHPRIRGERSSPNPCTTRNSGSSPHTRGTLPVDGTVHPDKRFIPAYAGNALYRETIWKKGTVHPRIRGERKTTFIASTSTTGSSPHTRGTQGKLDFLRRLFRFIPAYAGNAPEARHRGSSRPVHPRIRGERTLDQLQEKQNDGSSPHTRGTQLRDGPGPRGQRFIPAYAGNAQR